MKKRALAAALAASIVATGAAVAAGSLGLEPGERVTVTCPTRLSVSVTYVTPIGGTPQKLVTLYCGR